MSLPRAARSRLLLFVVLLLVIYVSTLVLFHIQLADTSAQRDDASLDDVIVSEKTPAVSVREPRLMMDDQWKRVLNNSTHVAGTTVRRLERCADVPSMTTAKHSSTQERRQSTRRRPTVNLVSPTLSWCDQHQSSVVVNSSSSFQLVADSHYVYSAYYDDRSSTSPSGVVRVIAVLKAGSTTPPTPTLFCHVDMSSHDWSIASVIMMIMWTSRYYTAPLHYYEMCENHGKDYGGWILTCPLPRGLRHPPCHILLSSSQTADPSSDVVLPVFFTRPRDSPPIRLTY